MKDYIEHICKPKNAKYIVVVLRELDCQFNSGDNIYCFKEYEWAKECLKSHPKNTGYPNIICSILTKVVDD